MICVCCCNMPRFICWSAWPVLPRLAQSVSKDFVVVNGVKTQEIHRTLCKCTVHVHHAVVSTRYMYYQNVFVIHVVDFIV